MISKSTKAQKYITVHYTHRIAAKYFGHSCGYLQGEALKRIDSSRYYRS
jgi:hypothetical protein